MQVVFFPEEFHARAPSSMGQLCSASTNEWVSIADVIASVRAGEAVTIRRASAQELQRAEGYVALYEIGVMLGQKLGELLDHESPEQSAAKIGAALSALGSIDIGLPNIIPQEAAAGEPVAGAAELGQIETVDALPQLYVALRNAYVAGDQQAVDSLDNQIQAILLGSAVAEIAVERARSAAE